jgi:hypothetical protein
MKLYKSKYHTHHPPESQKYSLSRKVNGDETSVLKQKTCYEYCSGLSTYQYNVVTGVGKCYKKLHATSKFEEPEASNEGPTNIRYQSATISCPKELAPAIWASLFLWPILTLSELTQYVRRFAHLTLKPLTRFKFLSTFFS